MLMFTICFIALLLNLPKVVTGVKLFVYGLVQAVATVLMYGATPLLLVFAVYLKAKGLK